METPAPLASALASWTTRYDVRRMNRKGGQTWRRVALATVGMMILSLLAWSVSEGAIYLGGTKVDRIEQPFVFWLEAVGIGFVGLAFLYLATFGFRVTGSTFRGPR